MQLLKIATRRGRIAIGFLGLCILGALGFLAFAWRSSIAPIDPPASTSFPAELIAKGEALAGAGYCATCHTAKGGATYAGGYGMPTPFGVIYSTNITPDPETGIGRWSEAAFARAMHEGVARDGSHLFPAFPFDHFTKVTDEDVKALYAYFMTRPPIRAMAQSNTVPFPLNIRLFQAGWKLLFVTSASAVHLATPTLHGWLHICGARAQNFQPGRTSRAKWRQSARNDRRRNEKSVWSLVIMTTFKLNDRSVSVDIAEDTPLLWVIRDEIGLKGTKFGCGIGMCGACTVHIDGRAVRSCITPLAAVANAAVTTIEGLDQNGQHPLQKAWIETQVPQCGYCQSGQIMQAATLLKDFPDPSDKDIDAVMSGNLCRCMAYIRIRRAIKAAAAEMRGTHG